MLVVLTIYLIFNRKISTWKSGLKFILILLKNLKFQVLELTGVNKCKCCFAIVVGKNFLNNKLCNGRKSTRHLLVG